MVKITISGMPGSGKSSLKDNLATKLQYASFISVGDIHGEIANEKGMNINDLMEFAKTDISIHKEMDKKVKEYGQRHKDAIIEGWIAYNFVPDSIKIFLDVDENTGAERIYHAQRKDEPKYTSIQETLMQTKKRLEDTCQGFQKTHKLDFLNKDQYDIIINTTNKTPEEVLHLADKKIIDYNQKMFPPTFYLAHPTESKKEVRTWQQKFEEQTKIKLINPFFDCNSLETEMGHLGKEKYLQMSKEQRSELIRGDLEGIADKKVIGGIFLFDKSYTLGTPLELALTKLMGKLTYTVAMHPEQAYKKHPTFALFSDEIFAGYGELENFMKKNKQNFFRDLEQSRQRTLKDSTLQVIYNQVFKNIELLAKE